MARLLLTNLAPGTTYKVQLRSVEGDSFSQWSREFDLPISLDNIAPDTPLWAASNEWVVSGDTFIGTWQSLNFTLSQNKDFNRYELELGDGTTTKIINTTNTSYTLTFDTNKSFFGSAKPTVTARVRAVDASGNASGWSVLKSATNPPPAAPTNFTANGMPDAVALAWDAVTADDLVGYNVYTGTPGTFTPSAGNKIFSGDVTKFNYRTTTYTTQYFKVRAVDKFGQESGLPDALASATPLSPFVVDTTPPATPAGLAATMVTSANAEATQANLTWTANAESDLAGYKIRYRKAGDTLWGFQDVGSDVTAASIFGLSPYVNYEFQIQAYDFFANDSTPSGTVTGTGATNSAPSQPAAPSVASNTLQIQVTPTGTKQAGGAMEADVKFYEVYASTTTGFTEAAANQIGVIPVGPAMAVTFQIPAGGSAATQTWYVKIKAVDSGGLKSTASPQATSTPGLIASTNIVDLAVTNAKINNLNADKIVAGSGIINDITVKSKLTLGDASNVGTIETYDYGASGGTTGASFSKNGIIIKTGAIEAPALRIQIGQNIMPHAWATMDTPYSARPLAYIGAGTLIPSTSTTDFMHGTQSLKVNISGTIPLDMVMSDSTTNDNIVVPEQGAQWIISMWVKSPTTNIPTISVRSNNVSQSSVAAKRVSDDGTSLVVNTWTRIYIVTSALNVSKAQIRVSMNGTGDWYFDSVQMEKLSPGNTSGKPSTWYPPSLTSIDGGMIKTGEIRSTNTVLVNNVTEPVWSIPLNGAATFSAMRVLGNTVLGNGPDDNISLLSSSNFTPGVDGAGWQLNASGNAVFKQVTADGFTGAIIARNTDITSDGYGSTVQLNDDGFFVRGSEAKGFPEYITFPTSGAPNIISGTLKAETMTVSGLLDPLTGINQGASFRGVSHFELGSEMILDNTISAPLAPPSVTQSVPKITFTGGPSNVGLLTYDSSNLYRIEWSDSGLVTTSRLVKYTLSGAWVSTTDIPKPSAPAGGSAGQMEVTGLVKLGSSWYFLWQFTGVAFNVISKHDGTTLALQTRADMSQVNNSQSWALGTDGTDLLIAHWNPFVTNGANRVAYVAHYNATTLAATGTLITLDSYPLANNSLQTGGGVVSVMAGTFDYGPSNKTYLVGFNYAQDPMTCTMFAFNSSGVRQQAREWLIDAKQGCIDGMAYTAANNNTSGGNFYHAAYFNLNAYKYVPNMWTGSESDGWGFAYSWYRNVGRTITVTTNGTGTVTSAGLFLPSDKGAAMIGTNIPAGLVIDTYVDANTVILSGPTTAGVGDATISYETKTSPNFNMVVQKRRVFTLTAALGPTDTVVRAYVGRGTSGSSYPTTPAQMRLQGTLGGGLITYTTPDAGPNFTSGKQSKETGTFPSGTAARMYTQQEDIVVATPVTIQTGNTTITSTSPIFYANYIGAVVTTTSGTVFPTNTKILTYNSPTSITVDKAPLANGVGTMNIIRPSVEIRGSGYARISELFAQKTILTSTQDAGIGANNEPPLRIGDINGIHMRADGNELQTMTDTNTPGGIIINQNGGTIKLGQGSQAFTSIDMGVKALAAGPGGQDGINHNCGGTPDVIMAMPSTGGAFRHVQVSARTSTNFTVQVMDAAGAAVANSTLQVFWIAIRL